MVQISGGCCNLSPGVVPRAILGGTVDLGRPLLAGSFPPPALLLQLYLCREEVNRTWALSQGENNGDGEGAAFFKPSPDLVGYTTAQRAAQAQWREHKQTAPSERCHQK